MSNECVQLLQTLRFIGHIRTYLDQTSCAIHVHTFIASKLDYCNVLLGGLQKQSLNPLQRLKTLQNVAARISNGSSINLPQYFIDSLGFQYSIGFEYYLQILFTTSRSYTKVLGDLETPSYILQIKVPVWYLRLSSDSNLTVPHSRTKTSGDQAFTICSRPLNGLPPELTTCHDLPVFKRGLKTNLFKEAYSA